jgi:DNA-binding NarL/FixJ family response regulator
MIQVAVVPSGGGQPILHCVLARRERQILALLSEGCANKEIAHELGISRTTVATRLAVLYSKTGLNRIQLALWAVAHPGVLTGAAVRPFRTRPNNY